MKAWNGGTNGLADRKSLMAGNDPILARLQNVASITAATPDAKKAPMTAEQGGGALALAATSATITAGAHAGWPWWAYAEVLIGLVAVGVAGYFGLRWWRARKSAEPAYHDKAIADVVAASEALPAPAAMWAAPDVQATKPAARKAQKASARTRAPKKAKATAKKKVA
ncbi:hypothetical protein AB7828_03400 [Tardiphaga sp. 215_C5_N2_1]|uniref:hypothetical protein n=1 Tax=Tardiphaga sp. 215_C5_N2_1 TaxID=3240774 RepID=UPI003F8CAA08